MLCLRLIAGHGNSQHVVQMRGCRLWLWFKFDLKCLKINMTWSDTFVDSSSLSIHNSHLCVTTCCFISSDKSCILLCLVSLQIEIFFPTDFQQICTEDLSSWWQRWANNDGDNNKTRSSVTLRIFLHLAVKWLRLYDSQSNLSWTACIWYFLSNVVALIWETKQVCPYGLSVLSLNMLSNFTGFMLSAAKHSPHKMHSWWHQTILFIFV